MGIGRVLIGLSHTLGLPRIGYILTELWCMRVVMIPFSCTVFLDRGCLSCLIPFDTHRVVKVPAVADHFIGVLIGARSFPEACGDTDFPASAHQPGALEQSSPGRQQAAPADRSPIRRVSTLNRLLQQVTSHKSGVCPNTSSSSPAGPSRDNRTANALINTFDCRCSFSCR